jgi:nucleoside 2-deoxyribosyltransferase
LHFHVIATLSGGRRKSVYNKTDEQALALVVQYLKNGTISATWGSKAQTYQVLELRIYSTPSAWHKPSGGSLEDFVKGKRNLFPSFEKRAKKLLGADALRVFVIMPIQGEEYGSQDEQRIFREYDQRFEEIEKILARRGCVALRIDKEHPLDGMVDRIKREIAASSFVVADLTDERPSCYFEVGYADALEVPVVYVASKESVVNPKTSTKIHFDIHKSVNYFVNMKQLREKLEAALDKNWEQLAARGSAANKPMQRTALPSRR